MSMPTTSTAELADWVTDARQRTFDLVADLTDEQLFGPLLPIVNPLIWEIGHIAWFQEKWVLRTAAGQPPIRADGDALYDSAVVAHDTRWDLPLPSRDETLTYMGAVRDRVLERLTARDPDAEEAYFIRLAVFHEDMHTEAFTYTRQTLGYPAPRFDSGAARVASRQSGPGLAANDHRRATDALPDDGALPGDMVVPGGRFALGAEPGREPFAFDNEKWAHELELQPFAIARAPVTQAEFAAFVEDEGYGRRELWSAAGWAWRERMAANHPVYWRRVGNDWFRRHFDQCRPLEPHRPVIHVSWYEADAYCRWARRRLPSEAEWEAAAATEPSASGHSLGHRKRRMPWGDAAPTPAHANLDWRAMDCVDVGAHPAGDSAWGCRQMMGNVWEWTSTDFGPFPGFVLDPYKEYSEPWFATHKVLRGGAWTTRGRLLRNTWRNFYLPDRRDVWSGFRTCRDVKGPGPAEG